MNSVLPSFVVIWCLCNSVYALSSLSFLLFFVLPRVDSPSLWKVHNHRLSFFSIIFCSSSGQFSISLDASQPPTSALGFLLQPGHHCREPPIHLSPSQNRSEKKRKNKRRTVQGDQDPRGQERNKAVIAKVWINWRWRYSKLEKTMRPTLLCEIKPRQFDYKVRVRVARLWRPKEFNGDIYDGLHYVLVDEMGDAIHGVIDESQYPYVTNKMEQGRIYDISHFYTREDVSKYKIVDHPVELHFNEKTKLILVEDIFPPIPQYSFRFLEFNELKAHMEGQTVLIHVCGCLKSIVPEHQIPLRNKDKKESICEIILENLREDLKVTLWGNVAKQFEIETVRNLPPPVLAVFTSLRITIYNEQITTSSSNHSYMIIDPDIPQAEAYKKEFSKSGDKVKIFPTPFERPTQEELKGHTRKTVSELNIIDPQLYMKEPVYCSASICRFPAYNGWWYKACPKCYKQLKQKENTNQFICSQHNIQVPIPWYRVNMTIEDADDQATVMLMGKQAEQLFGSVCQDLVNKRIYPTQQTLPEEIKKTISQNHLFQIKVDPNNKLIVTDIFPDVQAFLPSTQEDPANTTPDRPLSERKRTIETSKTVLFI